MCICNSCCIVIFICEIQNLWEHSLLPLPLPLPLLLLSLLPWFSWYQSNKTSIFRSCYVLSSKLEIQLIEIINKSEAIQRLRFQASGVQFSVFKHQISKTCNLVSLQYLFFSRISLFHSSLIFLLHHLDLIFMASTSFSSSIAFPTFSHIQYRKYDLCQIGKWQLFIVEITISSCFASKSRWRICWWHILIYIHLNFC